MTNVPLAVSAIHEGLDNRDRPAGHPAERAQRGMDEASSRVSRRSGRKSAARLARVRGEGVWETIFCSDMGYKSVNQQMGKKVFRE